MKKLSSKQKTKHGSVKLTAKDLKELLLFNYKLSDLKNNLTIVEYRKKDLRNDFENKIKSLDLASKNFSSEAIQVEKEYDSFKKELEKKYKLDYKFNDGSFDDTTGALFPPQL